MNYERLDFAILETKSNSDLFISQPVELNSILTQKIEPLPEFGWWRDELDLGQIPARILVQKHENSTEYLTLIPASFGGNQLDQILSKIAPFKEGVTPGGVIADWQALDDPEMAGLMRAHSNVLGIKHWETFVKNQPLWSETLAHFYDMDVKLWIGRYLTREQLTQRFTSQMVRGEQLAGSVMGSRTTKLEQFPELKEFFQDWREECVITEEFQQMSWDDKWDMAAQIIGEMEPDTVEHLLLDYVNLYQNIPVGFDGKEETVFDYGSTTFTYSVKNSSELLTVKIGDKIVAEASLGRDQWNRIVWVLQKETMANRETMFPILHWERNNATGERQWLMDFVDEGDDSSFISATVLRMMNDYESLLQQKGIVTQSPDNRIRFTQRANPLLGIAVLSLAEPEIRSIWPVQEGFSDRGGPQQRIGRAQVPIKLLKEERLLNSSVLADIENYVGNF